MDMRISAVLLVCGLMLLSGCTGTASAPKGAAPSGNAATPFGGPGYNPAASPSYVNQKCEAMIPGWGNTIFYFRDQSHFKMVGHKQDGSVSYTSWFDGINSYTMPANSKYGTLNVAASEADAAQNVQSILTDTPAGGLSCTPYTATDGDLARPSDVTFTNYAG